MNPFEHHTTRSIVEAAQAGNHHTVREILNAIGDPETLTVVLLLCQALDVDNPITAYQPNGVRRRVAQQIAGIVGLVAADHGVTPADVYTRNRTRPVAETRMISCAVACWLGNTMTDIGLCLDRDHSTVSSAVHRVEQNPRLRDAARAAMLRVAHFRGGGL